MLEIALGLFCLFISAGAGAYLISWLWEKFK